MGNNQMGQLGLGTMGDRSARCGSPCLVETLKQQKAVAVSCGKDFTLAITYPTDTAEEDPQSQVHAWGSNKHGQLGIPDLEGSSVPLKVDSFDILDEDVTSISCGSAHSLFLTSDLDVISCG